MTSARTDRGPAAAPPRASWLTGPWAAALLAAICYLNTLSHAFTYDDRALIEHNARIRSLTDFRAIWFSDWWRPAAGEDEVGAERRDRLYRPLTLFTLALNYAAGGLNPIGYHAANIAMHAAATALVWLLARRLGLDRAGAAVAGVLFAVHPIHVEAVANVVGRAEVLAACGLMLGLLALLSGPAVTAGRSAIAAACFLTALLAKETAICYPGLAAIVMLRRRPRPAEAIAPALVLLAPLALYFPLRAAALGGVLLRDQPVDGLLNPLAGAAPLDRAIGALTVLGHYTRLMLAPAQLSFDYGKAIVDPSSGPTAMTALGAVTALVLTASLVASMRRRPRPALVLSLVAMFLVSYALISNTVLMIGVSLAERLFYWPSVPLLIAAGLGLRRAWEHLVARDAGRRNSSRLGLARLLAGGIVVALALRTVVRNADWRDNLTLLARDAATHPQGAHINLCYARELVDHAIETTNDAERRRLLEIADRAADAALNISGGADAMGVLGQVRYLRGDAASASALLNAALVLRPDLADARRLRDLLAGGADVERRVAALRAALEHATDDARSRVELAELLLRQSQLADARAEAQRVLAVDPRDVGALRVEANALALIGRTDEAIAAFERVVALSPEDWQAHVNLAALIGSRDPPATLRHAEAALRVQPEDLRVQMNYAEALGLNGRTAEALAALRRLASSLPAGDPFRGSVEERIARLKQPPGE